MRRLLVLILPALLALAVPAAASVPPLLVPPHPDSVDAGSEPAPLLVPGREAPRDSSGAPRSRPEAALRQYALARALERQGNPTGAIVAYRNALKLDPKLPDAHLRMGRLYSAVAQHAAARKEYIAELRIVPGNVDADRALGLEQVQLGDSTRGLARLEALVHRNPADQPSWQALGFAYATTGRRAQAERALRQAVALDPRDADAWRDLGVVQAGNGRGREAREADRRAAALAPRDGTAMANLGRLEWSDGHLDAALQAYREATRRDSALVVAWHGQIGVLGDLHRSEEAGALYRTWLAREPGDRDLRMEVMRFFVAAGRADIALEVAREGVRIAPRSGEAHLALGLALRENRDAAGALAELRRAQAAFAAPQRNAAVGALVRQWRATAPDSLRAIFVADSLRYEAAGESAIPSPAVADSLHLAPER